MPEDVALGLEDRPRREVVRQVSVEDRAHVRGRVQPHAEPRPLEPGILGGAGLGGDEPLAEVVAELQQVGPAPG